MANKNNKDIPGARNWVLIVLILASLYLMSAIFANFLSIFSEPAELSGNIAVIPVKGVITSDGSSGLFGTSSASASHIIDMLEKAEKNSQIKGVLLEINSPGGSAVASEEVAMAVRNMDKPVVAWIREVGASGAYWISSASDHIVASRISVTGSIGVLSSYLEYAELLDRWNITYQRLVAGEYKDMGTPFRELEEEEKIIIEKKLDAIHDYFIRNVAENRNMSVEKVTEFANGLTYLGGEAVDMGLIDEIGSEDEALAYLENALNITADPVTYSQRRGFSDLFSGLISQHGFSIGKGLGSIEEKDNFIPRT